MEDLHRRCVANGVPVERLGPAGMRDVEPHVAGVAALHVPVTGIVDFREVSAALAEDLRADGVEIRTGVAVRGGRARAGGVEVDTDQGLLTATIAVNCGGLHADRIARAMISRRPTRADSAKPLAIAFPKVLRSGSIP